MRNQVVRHLCGLLVLGCLAMVSVSCQSTASLRKNLRDMDPYKGCKILDSGDMVCPGEFDEDEFNNLK